MSEPLPLPRGINPDIPESVERVILKAMARDPSDRFVSAGEMAATLEQTERETHREPNMASFSVVPLTAEESKKQVEKLYIEGLNAFWLKEWEQALRCFQAIVDVQPDYQDVAKKLKEAKLSALYVQAQAAMEAQAWQEAIATLEELTAGTTRYKDTEGLLEEARKQKQLADLYAQARLLHQAGQWQAVVNVFAQIHDIDPDYLDPENLLPLAERELAGLKRQGELSDFYGRALKEMGAGHWEGARQLLAYFSHLSSRIESKGEPTRER